MQVINTPTFETSDGRIHSSIQEAAKHEAEIIFEKYLENYDGASAAKPLSAKWAEIARKLMHLHQQVDAHINSVKPAKLAQAVDLGLVGEASMTTAIIKDAMIVRLPSGNRLAGKIYDDSRKKFADGSEVTTSVIKSVDGNTVTTQNSVYFVHWAAGEPC